MSLIFLLPHVTGSLFNLIDTCYIKTAIKLNNINICNPEKSGLSEGADVACYMDMAIHHKNKEYCNYIDYERFAILRDPLTLEKCHLLVDGCDNPPDDWHYKMTDWCTHESRLCGGFREKYTT